MTVNNSKNVVGIKLDMMELKLDRLIDEMRFLKSHTIAFDTRMRGIEATVRSSHSASGGHGIFSERGQFPTAAATPVP